MFVLVRLVFPAIAGEASPLLLRVASNAPPPPPVEAFFANVSTVGQTIADALHRTL